MKILFKLIHNENIKLYWQKATMFMLASLILMAVFSSFIFHRYDIDPSRQNLWDATGGQLWLMIFVNIFSAIVASGIVANEFSWGTVKFLLIRPFSRSKILLSKYIAMIIFSILLTCIIIIFSASTNAILYDNHSGLTSSFLSLIEFFALKYVEVFMYATLAFMLSVVSRNSAFAVGFSIVTIFLGPLVAYYLPNKYLLFSHLDLTRYLDNSVSNQSAGLTYSLVVLGVYFILFNLVSWTVFLKRDAGN